MLCSESVWSSGFCRTVFSFCCSQKPACAPVLSYPAFTCNRHRSTTWTREHFKVTWKIFFLQLSSGKCNGTDQHGQRHCLVAGLESPRDGVRWPREGRLPLSNEPSPKSQPGQCWKEALDQLGLRIRDFRPARRRKLFLWLTWGSSCYEARGW